jgi:hypothetical protein
MKRGEYMYKLISLFIVIIILSAFVSVSDSAIINAVSGSQTDLQAAIDSANDGDTIMVPAGSWTWTTPGTYDPAVEVNGKGITLQGAGVDQTIINDGTNSGWREYPLMVDGVEGKPFRIRDFTFNDQGSSCFLYIIGTCKNFRIDHCKFTECRAISIDGLSYGVIDHCEFYITNAFIGTPTTIRVGCGNYDDQAWQLPLTMGTSNAVYIEDCYFEFEDNVNGDNANAIHAAGGSRYALRYSTMICAKHEQFGACTSGGRGGFSGEIYNNYWSHNTWLVMIYFSGGSGVVFNNTLSGGIYQDPPFVLSNYRTHRCSCLSPLNTRCDGSSPIDGNLALESGTHTGSDNQATLTCSGKNWTGDEWVDYYVYNLTDGSKGKVTANTSDTITVTLGDGTENDWDSGDSFKLTNGYPCYDQVGRGENQTASPLYEWDNYYDTTELDFGVSSTSNLNGCSDPHPFTTFDHIQEGRDFNNDTPMPGYTPYIYPHPLVSGEPPPPPDTTPPDNIASVNDGTGTDIDSTYSTSQLSANWTAATDDESSITNYHYAIGDTPGSTGVVAWTTLGNVTSVTKAGMSLNIGTTYYFSVKAQSAGGTSNATSSDGQFVEGGGGPGDGIPPVISDINAVNIVRTGATITWNTDEPATSRVEYGATASYGNSTVEDSNLVTGHSVNLTDLIPGIEYHYRVISKDSSSNGKISIDYIFKTSGNEIDTKVYPNPYSPSKGSSMRFSVDGTGGGEVRIYTISGRLVKKLLIQSGVSEVNWDVLNEEGNSITAGLYIYTVTDGDGNKKTGKLAISN